MVAESVDMKEFVLDAAELSKIDFNLLTTQKEAISFWLNVFNIMVLHIYVENGIPSSKGRRRAMFHLFSYDIFGHQFTLEGIIEGVLRGNFKDYFKKKDPRAQLCLKQYDPRAHFGYSFLNETRFAETLFLSIDALTSVPCLARPFVFSSQKHFRSSCRRPLSSSSRNQCRSTKSSARSSCRRFSRTTTRISASTRQTFSGGSHFISTSRRSRRPVRLF